MAKDLIDAAAEEAVSAAAEDIGRTVADAEIQAQKMVDNLKGGYKVSLKGELGSDKDPLRIAPSTPEDEQKALEQEFGSRAKNIAPKSIFSQIKKRV